MLYLPDRRVGECGFHLRRLAAMHLLRDFSECRIGATSSRQGCPEGEHSERDPYLQRANTKGCTRVLRALVCSLAGVCLFACLSVCVCHEMNGLRGSSLSVPKRVSQV